MEIVNVPINDLKEADYNPRQMTEKQVADLTASIREFGLVDPIIVNKHLDRMNVVVGGHQRLKIARTLGFTEIPVVYVDLPLDREKRLNVRLNKNNGQWDWDLLANNFDKETLLDIGFDKNDLNMFDLAEDEFDEDAELAKIGTPKVQQGEVYVLGEHRIMCGDSTKVEDFKLLMGNEKARLIFTDPPYNVNYKLPGGLDYNSKKFGGTGGKIFNDNKSDEDCMIFYTDVLKRLYEFSTDDCSIYWWFAHKNSLINRMAFKETGWYFSQEIIWIKNSMVYSMGQDYHRRHEPCQFGWKDKKVHFKNRKYATFQDVVNLDQDDFELYFSEWYQKRDVTQNYIHPTQKLVRLAERALKKNSQLGDIVIDAFGGSGSTLIGCEQSGRKARVLELDPKYVHAILNRWSKYTGKDPIREDGMAWSEIVK